MILIMQLVRPLPEQGALYEDTRVVDVSPTFHVPASKVPEWAADVWAYLDYCATEASQGARPGHRQRGFVTFVLILDEDFFHQIH